MQRRTICRVATASAISLGGLKTAGAQKQPDSLMSNASDEHSRLDMVLAGVPGGGVDHLGRSLGDAVLAARLASAVQYENIAGKAGTVGLRQFVERHHRNPNAILVSGMALLGGLALHDVPVDLKAVTPLARLTSEYLTLVVHSSSPIASGRDLMTRLRDPSRKMTFVGGSRAGADHILFGMIRLALRAQEGQLDYLAAQSRQEALQALAGGRAQVGVSDFSEVQPLIKSGMLRALAISSRGSLHGLPSLKEVGLDVELSNWRGLFAPAGITDQQLARLSHTVDLVARSPEWARTLKGNDWVSSYKSASRFREDLEIEQAVVRVVVQLLKLKKPN
ncbi:MAG: tripartite tricarboxylate transporter substrate-binding protein [Hydrogenophaga sp.]|uniref:Bug family tripartite tricarboxylate transporter substrate binding protein n=1 Tax=Hydrogenophaga sp. TaxID=1904254 RepID=UPI00271DA769|nr:tripartite tricarboxylate transporter substrate-binding protein [Hydrogenophaga sp.]MDO9483309.1 tripartite tricarboxylate transporter substrate-binding protein [Hydrogenophaga sp.]MDP3345518.1 tripartite tricarboxylate transporter substrate-binding protein [Hydrogenophaga sp.]MDP3925391.1 tripartite tricarboxylate transporter substrate-binding protein [Hydrogenophaga sp.]